MYYEPRLFEGYESEPNLVSDIYDDGFGDMSEQDWLDQEPPRINVDFDASPDVPELHAAFATDTPVTLITKEGGKLTFTIESDLDYRGWLDNGVQPDLYGNIDTSNAPNFAFFQGQIHREGSPSPDPEPWIILIDPETGPNKVLEKIFFWHGDPLQLA